MKNSPVLKYWAAIVVALAVFLIGVSVGEEVKPSFTGIATNRDADSVSIMIDYGNGTILTESAIPLSSTTTVFSVLKLATDKRDIPLIYKDYGGDLGVFVNSINGVGKDPAGKKWWQFWINNAYSQVGVSSAVVNPGDVIEFKYIQGQQ